MIKTTNKNNLAAYKIITFENTAIQNSLIMQKLE